MTSKKGSKIMKRQRLAIMSDSESDENLQPQINTGTRK